MTNPITHVTIVLLCREDTRDREVYAVYAGRVGRLSAILTAENEYLAREQATFDEDPEMYAGERPTTFQLLGESQNIRMVAEEPRAVTLLFGATHESDRPQLPAGEYYPDELCPDENCSAVLGKETHTGDCMFNLALHPRADVAVLTRVEKEQNYRMPPGESGGTTRGPATTELTCAICDRVIKVGEIVERDFVDVCAHCCDVLDEADGRTV
jgi:hypothetical protein